ncbi:MAG TPA: shikimate kinase [Candidatus Limnocylindria bacterium]|nr:shikimate kinase [Candidatus Limnocylindria bacterium]
MPTDVAACRVILVGMMGSGKTTIGRLLSEATGWPYVDNDELVRRRSGTTARQVLAEGGTHRLREVESAALALGLELPPPVIVGVAAGTVLDPANRALMSGSGIVVWLRATAETLIARAGGAAHRPFVDRDGAHWMEETAAEREPLYAEIADLSVDTGVGRPEESVRIIHSHVDEVCIGPGAHPHRRRRRGGWTQGAS